MSSAPRATPEFVELPTFPKRAELIERAVIGAIRAEADRLNVRSGRLVEVSVVVQCSRQRGNPERIDRVQVRPTFVYDVEHNVAPAREDGNR